MKLTSVGSDSTLRIMEMDGVVELSGSAPGKSVYFQPDGVCVTLGNVIFQVWWRLQLYREHDLVFGAGHDFDLVLEETILRE
jgi:hypothetical protein